MSYMKLIKLLYLADREALARWGRPITTDQYVSTPRATRCASIRIQGYFEGAKQEAL